MPFHLARLVAERLESELSRLKLPKPGTDELATPAVYVGEIPDRGKVREPAPCVAVIPASGEVEQTDSRVDRHIVEVGLVCLIQTNLEDDQPMEAGLNILSNLVEACLDACGRPGPLGDVWQLEPPIRWNIFDQREDKRVHPFYVGAIETRWAKMVNRPRLTAEDHADVFGNSYP